MRYPVKIYEVERRVAGQPPPTPKLIAEESVEQSGLDECRRAVQEKVRADGYTLRTLSFSPDPPPDGSVIVYVWK